MERILLVEPNYANKYPPIGLMKIASYHKARGDYVEFYKGMAPFQMIAKMDRIYITSIFTFFFEITVDTILHYAKYIDKSKIYVGGIAATLMEKEFKTRTNINNVLAGQLTNSSMIGYDDNINIDTLSLNYDILDDIEYEYGVEDNFFAYTTRGCKRGCGFCAVKTLEPYFLETNDIINQISFARETYGDRRNLMLMDNNVFYSENLEKICSDIISLGFVKNEATYVPENFATIFYEKINRRLASNKSTWIIVDKFVVNFRKFITRIKKEPILQELLAIVQELDEANNQLAVLLKHKKYVVGVIEKYRRKIPLQRYVDFNQGIDARLLTNKNMKILSQLPLKPLRLAFDDVKMTKKYTASFHIAYKLGVRHFSNYMLYNFKDTPDDFWQRAYANVKLYNEFDDIIAFSFPMKYAPISMTDRSYIGKNWNKKYLSAMNVVLNVTKGVIAKGEDFFIRAYGKDLKEFHEILAMPSEFIKFRDFFEKNGFIDLWKKKFRKLSKDNKELLLKKLSGENVKYTNKKMLSFYNVTKKQVEACEVSIQGYQ
jgi:hypothetical protein